MKKFRFPLETLLKLRLRVRDERRRQLMQAHEAQRILEEQEAELASELLVMAHQGRQASQPGAINVDRLLEQHRYSLLLQTRQQVLKQQQSVLEEEIERRRQALTEADTDVRAIERLRERRLEDHRLEVQRLEQREADEVAVTHWQGGEP